MFLSRHFFGDLAALKLKYKKKCTGDNFSWMSVLCFLPVALCIFKGKWCLDVLERMIGLPAFCGYTYWDAFNRFIKDITLPIILSFCSDMRVAVSYFKKRKYPEFHQHCIIKKLGIALWVDLSSLPLLHSGQNPKLFDKETLTWMWVHLRDIQ